MPTYLQGLTIGLAYVAPIGMQNLFVINSALTQPPAAGPAHRPDRDRLRHQPGAGLLLRHRRAGGALRLAAAPDSDRGRLHRGVDRHRPAAG